MRGMTMELNVHRTASLAVVVVARLALALNVYGLHFRRGSMIAGRTHSQLCITPQWRNLLKPAQEDRCVCLREIFLGMGCPGMSVTGWMREMGSALGQRAFKPRVEGLNLTKHRGSLLMSPPLPPVTLITGPQSQKYGRTRKFSWE